MLLLLAGLLPAAALLTTLAALLVLLILRIAFFGHQITPWFNIRALALQGSNPGGLITKIKDFRARCPAVAWLQMGLIEVDDAIASPTGAYFPTAPQRTKFWDFESDAEAGALGFLFAGP
ncbi:MAG TPA: hypothetical protein VFF11_04045 [Candidatus Binatia bacterium]|nr:hypothetical protein [Candidatus Binatia bacterium]